MERKEILIEKTNKRAEFVEKAFLWGGIFDQVKDKKRILIKPNIVSFEPYPTTTHPEVLKKCLELILERKTKDEIIVADGPAFDAGDSEKILKDHPLRKVTQDMGVLFVNLNKAPKRKIKLYGYSFQIAEIVLGADYIISLPVLKVHKICKITGALKNQYGVLSPKNKLFYHLPFKDINKAIAILNKIVKVDFFIVDAIKTLIGAQERRHGGIIRDLGYMLAGSDPLKLDLKGFSLLQKIDGSLKCLGPEDVSQFQWAEKLLKKDLSY